MRGWSRLRSGREHWAWMVVVEVRHAGNTGRGRSWLRSGREHWAWMVVVEVRHPVVRQVVVEVRQGTLGVDGRG